MARDSGKQKAKQQTLIKRTNINVKSLLLSAEHAVEGELKEIAEEFKHYSDITYHLYKENPYIHGGYRDYTRHSFWECTKSTCCLHNDFMNIWTHLIPIFYTIYLCYQTFTSPLIQHADFGTRVAVGFFFAGALNVFTFSTLYHIYRSHSIKMFKLFLLFDVASIAINIGCSVGLMAYFEMYCFPTLQTRWVSGIIALFLVSAFAVPYLMRHGKFTLRTLLLMTFAGTGFAAHCHRAYLTGSFNTPNDMFTLWWVLVMYSSAILGLIVRRTRLPESLFPGKFDVWFASHQLFHMLINVAPWALYNGYVLRFLRNEWTCPAQ